MDYSDLLNYGKHTFGLEKEYPLNTISELLAIGRKLYSDRSYEIRTANLAKRLADFIDQEEQEKSVEGY